MAEMMMSCRDCRHWQLVPHWIAKHEGRPDEMRGWGECNGIPQNLNSVTLMKLAVTSTSGDAVSFYTAPDFGCRLFEVRAVVQDEPAATPGSE